MMREVDPKPQSRMLGRMFKDLIKLISITTSSWQFNQNDVITPKAWLIIGIKIRKPEWQIYKRSIIVYNYIDVAIMALVLKECTVC